MKRVFGSETASELDGSLAPQLKKQRPLFGMAMREVMGVQCMQRHLPKLEPFLRRVVQEEVGNALCRFVHSSPRLPINRIQAGVSRRYQLQFQNGLPQTLFTGSRIEAEGKVPVEIVMMDTELNKKITSGPLSSAKIEILVLDGDFGSDDHMEWTVKEFNEGIVREREGKRPLLTGDLVITLNDGVGCLGDVSFTDNSSWIRSRKFRLGLRLVQSRCVEASVQEAISGAFVVKDHRGELYRKHHPPSPDDEVWRLEKIGKDGAFHKRLSENGINTVQDFLKNLVMDQDRLRSLLGSGMPNKIWEATVEHAKECVPDDKNYMYCSGQGVTLLFDYIFQLAGAMLNDRLYPLEDLTASQMVQVNKLKQLAYKNPEQIIELGPLTGTLPLPLPASDVLSLPQAGCSEPQNPHLSAPHEDELAAQVSVTREPPSPCNGLLDPSQLKQYLTGQDYHPGQCSGPLQANSFNMRDFLDTQFRDIPSVGLAGQILAGDYLTGYNPELDVHNPLSPLPIWEGTEPSEDLVPRMPGIAGSNISSGRCIKLVAALKLMANSKRMAAKRDNKLFDLGYSALASNMSNEHGGWFGEEG